jgi:hypothetical protein
MMPVISSHIRNPDSRIHGAENVVIFIVSILLFWNLARIHGMKNNMLIFYHLYFIILKLELSNLINRFYDSVLECFLCTDSGSPHGPIEDISQLKNREASYFKDIFIIENPSVWKISMFSQFQPNFSNDNYG